jgi:preprotein translocase subunit SecG
VSVYLYTVQIILSIALIVVILVQSKGAGGLGGLFGGGDSSGVYKTRRGVERTLFQVTIGLGIIFLVFSVLNVLLS